jgi:D-alanyl-D-alanine carboxypeptidase
MDEIDDILKKEVEENKTPSVQYIFFNKDNVIHTSRFGLADIKNQATVDENTTYNAYSVTKTFTALAVLQLVEQNKVDIKQPIKDYLPEFPYTPDITVHQLLAHSAGIPNPIPLSWVHLASDHSSFDRNQFFNNIFAKNKKLKSKPNEKYSYSNLGYVLLGQLIEKVSGVRFEQYINEHIINKLDLPTPALGFEINDPNKHATGYHKRRSFSNLLLGLFIDKSKYMAESVGKWKPFKNIYVNGSSYGGLIGTPYAFVRYIQRLLQSNATILSEEYKKILFTENRLNSNKASAMCLSWFKGKLNNENYFAHAGGGGGYYCEIRMYPELELGSVVMFNRSGMRDERYLDKVDKYALAERIARR